MSIQEVKQKTAIKYGFSSWNLSSIIFSHGESFTNLMIDEAMDLYHRSQKNL